MYMANFCPWKRKVLFYCRFHMYCMKETFWNMGKGLELGARSIVVCFDFV